MTRFYVYGNTNQAYEALTYNDIVCSAFKKEAFRIATVSFRSSNFIFLSAEKICESGRFNGIDEENNQYPVTFEITIPDTYDIKCRFITSIAGEYRLDPDFKPLSSFGEEENGFGAFVYGHIPFSFVSKIIFENDENKNRFFRAGKELWFPQEIFSTWHEEPYASLPKKTLNWESLKEKAIALDDSMDQNLLAGLNDLLSKQSHMKTSAYLAVESTKNWKLHSVRTNIDSAIISLFDAGTGKFKRLADAKLASLLKLFPFVEASIFEEPDPALQCVESENHRILIAIVDAIAETNYSLEQNKLKENDTINKIKNLLSSRVSNEPELIGGNYTLQLDQEEPVVSDNISNLLDAINTFTSSRLGDADVMLERTQENDILYAFALCIKNKGDIEKVRRENNKLPQNVRRYAYIIAGLTSSMADISGDIKSNRALEKNLTDIFASRFADSNGMLFMPKSLVQDTYGIDPEIYLDINKILFKEKMQAADEKSLEYLYTKEFSSAVTKKELSAIKDPIQIVMDGKEYYLYNPDSIKRFKRDLTGKIKSRTKFSKDLFLSWLFDKAKDATRELYEKYSGLKH